MKGAEPKTIIKLEVLADLDYERAGSIINFDACERLGAVNLRGTGFAARDIEVRHLRARIGGVDYAVDVNVTGLAGFLLAKIAAAYGRRQPKDWYDIAFVLLHNDAGGPDAAAETVCRRFSKDLSGQIRTALHELRANFYDPTAQGPQAYAVQMRIDHPDLDATILRADAVLAVQRFFDAIAVD